MNPCSRVKAVPTDQHKECELNNWFRYDTQVKVINNPGLGYISGLFGRVVGVASANDGITMYIIDFGRTIDYDYYPYTCAVVPDSMLTKV